MQATAEPESTIPGSSHETKMKELKELIAKAYQDDGAILVIDGGLASELQNSGFDIDGDPLWSARLLQTNPSAIKKVHKAYINAGASIITCASYQASIAGFKKHLNLSKEESLGLIERSVAIAKEALVDEDNNRQGSTVWIAGSVGPYGACLHDGSEYTGAYISHISQEELTEWHRPRIRALVDAGVDLLAIETIPSKVEAESICRLVQRECPHVPVWVTFTCRDDSRTSRGETIEDVVDSLVKFHPQVIGLGVNCCDPELVPSLLSKAHKRLKEIRSPKYSGKQIDNFVLVAYPNSGELWSPKKGWYSESGEKSCPSLSSRPPCLKWIDSGARIIGGCCRVGPSGIREMKHIISRERKVH